MSLLDYFIAEAPEQIVITLIAERFRSVCAKRVRCVITHPPACTRVRSKSKTA